MREITTHQTNAANEQLRILVLDGPGAGGASHDYDIVGFPSDPLKIRFQNGPIAEAGVNGITQEALLAIIIDRLACFQEGPYACKENELALYAAQECLTALQSRTKRRVEAGIEGTHIRDDVPDIDGEELETTIMNVLGEVPPPVPLVQGWTNAQKQQVLDYCAAMHATKEGEAWPARPDFFPKGERVGAGTGAQLQAGRMPAPQQPANTQTQHQQAEPVRQAQDATDVAQ